MENQQQTNSEKLAPKFFMKELEQLLKKAPSEIALFINATPDPANEDLKCPAVFALQGSLKNLTYGLFKSFEVQKDFKDVIFTAVDVQKHRENIENIKSASSSSHILGALLAAALLKEK